MASSARRHNTAYQRGEAARMRGKPFSSNPYKDPICSTNWSLGWIDYGAQRKEGLHEKFPEMAKRRRAHLKTVR